MADERLDRIEKSIEDLTKVVNRLGRYAMVIARYHENELGDHARRILALEEGENGDTLPR